MKAQALRNTWGRWLLITVLFLSRALNLDVQGGINNFCWEFVGSYGVSNGKQDCVGKLSGGHR